MLWRCAFYIVSFFSSFFLGSFVPSHAIFLNRSAVLCYVLSFPFIVCFCSHEFRIRCTTSKQKQKIIFSRLQWRAILRRKDELIHLILSNNKQLSLSVVSGKCTKRKKEKSSKKQQHKPSPFASWWSQSNENFEQSEFHCFLSANICLQRLQASGFENFRLLFGILKWNVLNTVHSNGMFNAKQKMKRFWECFCFQSQRAFEQKGCWDENISFVTNIAHCTHWSKDL